MATDTVTVAQPPKAWMAVRPYVVGGSAGMISMCFLQPVDTVKVRLQLQGEGVKGVKPSFANTVRNIIANEGALSLYKGLSAALLRQATYTTSRMGLFNATKEEVSQNYFDGKALPTYASFGLGMVAGGFGAVAGTPADLALVRMQADGTLPKEQRRNYTGVGNALGRIVKEEGFFALWKGCAPTVVRAMAVNAGIFGGFEKGKTVFRDIGLEKSSAEWAASGVAGFLASVFGLPFDFVKTRIQKQRPDSHGNLLYKNPLDCVVKVAAQEGPLAFYKGFGTFYMRIAPAVMLQLILNEEIAKALKTRGW
eukprot:tig00000383_g24641.t1